MEELQQAINRIFLKLEDNVIDFDEARLAVFEAVEQRED